MNNNDELKIMNMKQVSFYIDYGIQPLRVENGYGGKIVFIYSKKATNKLYGLWLDDCKNHKNLIKHIKTQPREKK